MSAIPNRHRLKAPLIGASTITLLIIALFAPLPVLAIATILAIIRAGDQRRLWIGVALFAMAILLWLLVGVDNGSIHQPVRVN
jgi:hypothetical protein